MTDVVTFDLEVRGDRVAGVGTFDLEVRRGKNDRRCHVRL